MLITELLMIIHMFLLILKDCMNRIIYYKPNNYSYFIINFVITYVLVCNSGDAYLVVVGYYYVECINHVYIL